MLVTPPITETADRRTARGPNFCAMLQLHQQVLPAGVVSEEVDVVDNQDQRPVVLVRVPQGYSLQRVKG